MQDGVGRHHVRTAEAQGHAVAVDSFHLTAAAGGLSLSQQFAIDDALTNSDHRFAGGAEGGGVFRTLNEQTADGICLSGFWQLRNTGLLAEDLGGGDHIASFDGDAVFHLQLGVGGAVAGVGHGVATHQDRLKDHQPQTGDCLGPFVRGLLHIHGHLRRGVEGLQDQLGLEQFNALH